MLSILIPTYNYDVRFLVRKLHEQAEASGLRYEIICLDDASIPAFQKLNAEIANLSNLCYGLLHENLGRSAIRNRLAKLAKYEYLLFMDCDTMPETSHFLDIYIRALKPQTVLYGGRTYASEAPSDANLFFHWFYGSNREVTTLEKRREFPYRSFMTNNFVIPKSLLLDIGFDETIKQYGHEDTLFGLELKKRSISILHLDNPMRHIGLETATDFLRKSEQAIENLLSIMQKHDLQEDIKLLRYFIKTKKWGLHPLIRLWFNWNRNRLRKILLGGKPSLRSFDLYKLGYMCNLK